MRLLVLLPFASMALALAAQAPRESILDRRARLEADLAQKVPDVKTLCEGLGIKGRMVEVGDVRLFVEEAGKGAPIVLLHGGPGGTHHGFHPWFQRAERFAKVITYDQRGCGRSEWKAGTGFTVEQSVADLEALRVKLGYERWTVLGWSYGGFLAQLYALRHPERTAGLVLVGASPGLQDDFGTRQDAYLSESERAQLKKVAEAVREARKREGLGYDAYVARAIFNNTLNGDWKRQGFYRPTREEAARTARFEWNNPPGLNGDLNQSADRYDLKGAFADCPIPTLILEGRFDLTWGEAKAKALAANHPRASIKVFERSAHAIFSEEPEAFFKVLRAFQASLRSMDSKRLAAFAAHTAPWRAQMEKPILPIHWDAKASREIRAQDGEAWLTLHPGPTGLLRLGFAHYDGQDFEAALGWFRRLESAARDKDEAARETIALLWQGHVLDLLGRREEAVAAYRRAEARPNLKLSHGQYGLTFASAEYARQRQTEPYRYRPNGMEE